MMVDLTTYVDVVPKEVGITELVYYPALKKILDEMNPWKISRKQFVKRI